MKNDFDFLNHYQILGSIRLEDLLRQPSSSLYRFLVSVKKSTFIQDDRIVFYNFAPLTNELFGHIKQTLDYLDIPTFFILIITDQLDTIKEFDGVDCRLVKGIDDQSDKNSSIIPLFNTNGFMCAEAWSGVYLFSNGTASACCNSQWRITKPNGTPYNIQENTMEEMLDSEWMRNLRQQFRQGQRSDNCEVCWRREDLNQSSRRTIAPYKMKNIYGLIDWEGEGQLMTLGGFLGNLCNLKCRICSSQYSSTIAIEALEELPKDQRKSSTHYKNLKDAEWAFDDVFWNNLKDHADQIKNYELLGGEPFMLRQIVEFMKYLVDTEQSQDAMFYFSTNGTVYPEVLDYVDKFRLVEITFSIDNLDDRFELERCNAIWDKVQSNIDKFFSIQGTTNKLKLNVSISVGIQNVYYLPEIITWVKDKKFNAYYLNYVDGPSYYSIINLTQQARVLVLDKLRNANFKDSDKEKLDGIIDIIENSTPGDGVEFCRTTRRFDLLRNQNFAQTHTDIAKAMGYE